MDHPRNGDRNFLLSRVKSTAYILFESLRPRFFFQHNAEGRDTFKDTFNVLILLNGLFTYSFPLFLDCVIKYYCIIVQHSSSTVNFQLFKVCLTLELLKGSKCFVTDILLLQFLRILKFLLTQNLYLVSFSSLCNFFYSYSSLLYHSDYLHYKSVALVLMQVKFNISLMQLKSRRIIDLLQRSSN